MTHQGPTVPPRTLVIFDLCDTLYNVNTTVDFLRYYQSVSRNSRIANAIRRWTASNSPWFYLGAFASRLLGLDIARRKLIGSLVREPRAMLEEAASRFVVSALPARANAPVMERLNAHVKAGDEVVIVSSSLDIVVSNVAALLGVAYRASSLGFEGELCTGRLERDLTGKKAAAISDLLQYGQSMLVYTDNRSDRDLIALSDRAIIILPSGKSVLWAGESCDYIRL